MTDVIQEEKPSKDYFIKRVMDANKLTGHYIDTNTAELLWDRFYDTPLDIFNRGVEQCIEDGEKITYKVLKEKLRRPVHKKEEEKKTYRIVEECKDHQCKECCKHVICMPMNNKLFPLLNKLLAGDIKYETLAKELEMEFPGVGWEKTYTRPKGVIMDENGEFINVY